MSEEKMTLKRAIAEVIQENPIMVGICMALLGQLLDRVYSGYPLFTVGGFVAGYGLYILSRNYTERRTK